MTHPPVQLGAELAFLHPNPYNQYPATVTLRDPLNGYLALDVIYRDTREGRWANLTVELSTTERVAIVRDLMRHRAEAPTETECSDETLAAWIATEPNGDLDGWGLDKLPHAAGCERTVRAGRPPKEGTGVVGSIEQSMAGNSVLRIGPMLDEFHWTQLAHLVLTSKEREALVSLLVLGGSR